MLPNLLALIFGALVLPLFTTIPSTITLALSFGIIIISWIIAKFFWPKTFLTNALKYLGLFLLGLSWATLNAHMLLNQRLPEKFINKPVTVEGQIVSVPQKIDRRTNFIFHTNEISKQKIKLSVNLTCYNRCPAFKVGDKWRFYAKLKPPHSTQNPGSKDREAYLFSRKIRARGYIVMRKKNTLVKTDGNSFFISRLRSNVANAIATVLPDNASGIIPALVVGKREHISNSTWKLFQKTGTVHLVAIAGLHIGFVATIVFVLSRLLFRRFFSSLFLYIPDKEIAAILALVSALLYSALTGFSLPTLRAFTMLTLGTVFLLLRRNTNSWNIYILAMLIVLLINPLAPLTGSFWLSFTAVAAIIYTLQKTKATDNNDSYRIVRWLKKYLHLQLALTVGLFPLSLYLFQQTSIAAILANLVAIPWLGFVILPISFLGALLAVTPHFAWLAHYVLLGAERVIAVLFYYLNFLAKLPFTNLQWGIQNSWILFLAVIGAILILSPRKWQLRLCGTLFFLPIFFYSPLHLKNGEFNFTMLDVGQGLASVITTSKHTLIYDTGIKTNEQLDSGNLVIVPFLNHLNIHHIDTLMVSHGDNDHIGGANSLITTMPPDSILSSVPYRFITNNSNYCHAGQHWNWDGVNFEVLFPPLSEYTNPNSRLINNNASCILRVSNEHHSVLLTGDIERRGEKVLLKKNKVKLASEVFQAPHHGSNGSLYKPFFELINPQYVLFPVGFLNRFHFPSEHSVKFYSQFGAKLLDTATSGAITFYFPNSKKKPKIDRYRISHRRFWNSL